MKINSLFPILTIALSANIHAQSLTMSLNPEKIEYPKSVKSNTIDTYFNQKVEDPYRWLEDDLSIETKNWVEQQNKVTQNYLKRIPIRNQIREKIEKLWNYEKFSAPFKEGNYTYYFKNDGLQNQSVLYRFIDENEEHEVFLDPNKFSKDGTSSLGGMEFSKDGSLVAFQISEGGSDWRKVIVWNTQTKTIVDDTLKDIKFSGISWLGNSGFYYSSYDKPKNGSELSAKTSEHKVYFHEIGNKQSQDKLVFGGEKNPRRYISADITENGDFLILSAANSTTGNELYVQDLRVKNAPIQVLVNNFSNSHSVILSIGDTLFIQTNLGAPNRKLVKISCKNLDMKLAKTVIPESEMPLNVSTGAGKLFAVYLKDAVSYVEQYNPKGKKEYTVELPGKGTVSGFGGKWNEKDLYFSFTNYLYPSSIFKYSPDSKEYSLYKKPNIDFNPEDYVSYQVFYTSKDGTKVPMMITHKKGLVKNGQNPTILYGYGGFNISLTPSFSPATAAWLSVGGIYAVANLRGGGEYGKKWHDAGTKMRKQNVFDDFISAAEFLIKDSLTNSDKLAISGGSNGGLLVGACMTQRPELFAVALPAVGVLDMLRYHTFTAGAGWAYDYGTAEDSKEMFEYLKAYSPLHNLKPNVKYPATLVFTADHDDRVVPAHSFKFAARLQEVNTTTIPTLIRIDTKAGHGAGKPTSMLMDEHADRFAFSLFNMGIYKLQ